MTLFSLLIASLLSNFALCKKQSVQYGTNGAGFTFTVREGAELIFDPVFHQLNSTCSESFIFTGYIFEFIAQGSKATTVVPCSSPLNSSAEIAHRSNISADIFCYKGSRSIFKLTCFLDGQAVSRRVLPLHDEAVCNDQPSALSECGHSLYNAQLIKEQIINFMNPLSNTSSPKAYNDHDTRQLSSVVSGENKVRSPFEISDSGLVKFLPRVGEQCTESYLVPNASIAHILSAVSNSSITPCGAFPRAMTTDSIDSAWTIVPAVDCSDPEYIAINCAVSFEIGQPSITLTRRATYQVGDSRTFLSRRINCNEITDNETLECANIAKNYARIVSSITN